MFSEILMFKIFVNVLSREHTLERAAEDSIYIVKIFRPKGQFCTTQNWFIEYIFDKYRIGRTTGYFLRDEEGSPSNNRGWVLVKERGNLNSIPKDCDYDCSNPGSVWEGEI